MLDHLPDLKTWKDNRKHIALARVIQTWGSSPRPTGSVMLVNEDGHMAGSVSGGCVEGAVVKASREIIDAHSGKNLAFGVSDEEAWNVGLSCGGSIQVYLQPITFEPGNIWDRLVDNLESNRSSILITSLVDGKNTNTLIDESGVVHGDQLPEAVIDAANAAYDTRVHTTVEEGGIEYFIHLFPRKPQLLIIGAAHITVDLVRLGNLFGFETIVIDPRGYFAKNTVFPDPPAQRLEAYPSEVLDQFALDAYTFCAILSHDPKIDDNALEILLPSKVAYIGALGSRKNQAKRQARLLEKGFSQKLIDRVHGPIGLNIRAKSAQEIALSIMGQIISVKNENM